jgi:hypothetical protein
LADEDRLAIVDSCIQPYAQLVAESWAGSDPAEARQIQIQQVAVDYAALLIALPIRKKEDTVPLDWSSRCKAKLPPLKERIGIRRVPREGRISG